MKVWAHIADCLSGGDTCALVTVSRVEGSTPRECGARMVVTAGGNYYGTIGGGTLEFEAIRKASEAAAAKEAVFLQQVVSLGPDLGQCCGGRVHLAIEVFNRSKHGMVQALAGKEAEGVPFGTVACLENGAPVSREISHLCPEDPIAVKLDPVTGSGRLLERFGASLHPLFLFGAGHVGKALVLSLAPLPFDVSWIDSRAAQFPGPVPANVRKVCVSDPPAVLKQAPDGAFVLAMSHSHALDEEIMARALLEQRFAYCGVIGSATKRARFAKRLKSRGINDALISKMACPVGVTAIKSKHPAVIAAGIAVDLLTRKEALHQQAAAGEGLAQISPYGQ